MHGWTQFEPSFEHLKVIIKELGLILDHLPIYFEVLLQLLHTESK